MKQKDCFTNRLLYQLSYVGFWLAESVYQIALHRDKATRIKRIGAKSHKRLSRHAIANQALIFPMRPHG